MKNLEVEEVQSIIKQKISKDLITAEHSSRGHFYRHSITGEKYASVTTKCGILDAPHLKAWAARLAVEYIIDKLEEGGREHISPLTIHNLKDSAILAHQDEVEEAGDIGTRGHAVIETYLKEWIRTKARPASILSFIKDEDSRIFAVARSAEKFCIDYDVTPIVSEMFVASTRYKFAGTLDSLMMVTRVTKKGNGICRDTHKYWMHSTRDKNKVMCKDCGQLAEREFALVDFKTSNSVDKVEYAMQVAAYSKAITELIGVKPKRHYILQLSKEQMKYNLVQVVNVSKAFKAFVQCSKLYDWMNDNEEKLVSLLAKEKVSLNSLTTNG